jgi:hypothetical protein
MQIALSSNFGSIICDSNNVPDSFVTFRDDIFPSLTSMWLRVSSRNQCGQGLWSPPYQFILPYNGIRKLSNELPKEFQLYQNYPNPFNPSTKIKFEIPKCAFTNLIVYDIVGREVATLVNEKLQPGTYEVEWSAISGGTNYPSGVYIYKFISGDYSVTKRMVLIK